jgi:hypothetical protein
MSWWSRKADELTARLNGEPGELIPMAYGETTEQVKARRRTAKLEREAALLVEIEAAIIATRAANLAEMHAEHERQKNGFRIGFTRHGEFVTAYIERDQKESKHVVALNVLKAGKITLREGGPVDEKGVRGFYLDAPSIQVDQYLARPLLGPPATRPFVGSGMTEFDLAAYITRFDTSIEELPRPARDDVIECEDGMSLPVPYGLGLLVFEKLMATIETGYEPPVLKIDG